MCCGLIAYSFSQTDLASSASVLAEMFPKFDGRTVYRRESDLLLDEIG